VEKSVDYYMSLPYTVELEPDGKRYRASVEELPGCYATVEGSESVDELWRRLKEAQRQRIEELVESGEEVLEPAGAGADPFLESLPDGLDEPEARTMVSVAAGLGVFSAVTRST
jgi:predicted RNase H-like HicB family nuclease